MHTTVSSLSFASHHVQLSRPPSVAMLSAHTRQFATQRYFFVFVGVAVGLSAPLFIRSEIAVSRLSIRPDISFTAVSDHEREGLCEWEAKGRVRAREGCGLGE